MPDGLILARGGDWFGDPFDHMEVSHEEWRRQADP